MIKNYIENANFEDTGFSYTLSHIWQTQNGYSVLSYGVQNRAIQ